MIKTAGFLGMMIAVVLFASGVSFGRGDYRVGDRGPAGGWIFYDKGDSSDGWRYLEAGPDDIGKAKYGCYGTTFPEADKTAVGAGKNNTRVVVRGCREKNTAAAMCAAYRGGGKSDWFLPSRDELSLVYENLYKKGIGGLTEWGYWSSSEQAQLTACYVYFKKGAQYAAIKDEPLLVRPVRAF